MHPYDPTEPKRVVADGYDQATARFEARAATIRDDERAREETADEDGKPVTFLWMVARKPFPTNTEDQP